MRAVQYVKEWESISNPEHQELAGVGKGTASNGLSDLVRRGLLSEVGGQRGRGATAGQEFGRMAQKGPETGRGESLPTTSPKACR